VLGPSIYNVMLGIGLLRWPAVCRLVRAQVLSLREQDFVLAARSVGVPAPRIASRHILPNLVSPLVVAATFGFANAVITEAGLSFLGLGVQPPTASWGNILNAAQKLSHLADRPWMWIPAGVLLSVTILAINFAGDGLRDALDPRIVIEH
jgi:peptide/nickel transport system permease protein